MLYCFTIKRILSLLFVYLLEVQDYESDEQSQSEFSRGN